MFLLEDFLSKVILILDGFFPLSQQLLLGKCYRGYPGSGIEALPSHHNPIRIPQSHPPFPLPVPVLLGKFGISL